METSGRGRKGKREKRWRGIHSDGMGEVGGEWLSIMHPTCIPSFPAFPPPHRPPRQHPPPPLFEPWDLPYTHTHAPPPQHTHTPPQHTPTHTPPPPRPPSRDDDEALAAEGPRAFAKRDARLHGTGGGPAAEVLEGEFLRKYIIYARRR